jgi:hypothetical protein
MKNTRVLSLVAIAALMAPSIQATMINGRENAMDLKEYSFINCTESIVEVQLKCPQDGKVIAHIPRKNLDNPNHFTIRTEYANMEEPVLVIKIDGAVRPYTVFKGNYNNGPKGQHKCQVPAGRYKIIADPYKTDKSLLLVDQNMVSRPTFPCFPNGSK